MAGYFKIINRNSLLLQARTKTRKVGGLLKIITWGETLKWKLNFLINDFLTVNQKWGGCESNGSINRSILTQALKEICNHFLLADCGTYLNFQRLLQKAHITFYNTIGLVNTGTCSDQVFSILREQAVCLRRLLDLKVQHSPLFLVWSLYPQIQRTLDWKYLGKVPENSQPNLEFSAKAKFV